MFKSYFDSKCQIFFDSKLLSGSVSATEVEDYRNYFRMNEKAFNTLLQKIEPLLQRKNTTMRESLSVQERLTVTLRYLATGRNFEDLKFSVAMSPASISYAIVETCQALIHVLQEHIILQFWMNFVGLDEGAQDITFFNRNTLRRFRVIAFHCFKYLLLHWLHKVK